MTDIFTLGIKADTRDIDRGKKSADRLARSLVEVDRKARAIREGINVAGKALVAFGVTATAALGVVVTQSADAAREIENLARISGLTVEQFQRAAFAARSFGIEQDKLGDILKDVQDKVGDFLKTGGGPMLDFFEQVAPRVGVTADMFRKLNGKDALQLYVSSLEQANLSQSEMVFFLEAIASDATLLQPLLANNGEEFQRLAKRADELGIVLDKIDISNLTAMKTALGELNAISQATANIIGATLSPFITDLVGRFNDATVAGDTLRGTIVDLVNAGVKVAGIFADAGRAFEIVGRTLGALAFTVVESNSTIGVSLDLAVARFVMWANSIDLIVADWANNLLRVAADAANGLLETFNVFGVLDNVTIEAPQIDTSGLESTAKGLAVIISDLESELEGTNDNIANAWQDVLDLMAQPLPSEGFDVWFEAIEKTITAQRRLQKEIKKTGDGSNVVVRNSAKDAIKFISNTKEVTKGLAAAFGENEKAAEALHRVNQVIAIAEQAMILQKVFLDSAATPIHIANSAAKSTANATEAVTEAASAPFPVGFAAAAAMIGLMASVLGGFGGGGASAPSVSEQRQQAQGTGTVFGSDEKSQSIIDSQERFEDISIAQLAELRGMRSSLDSLVLGITQLAGSVISGGLGEFGGATGVTAASLGGFLSKTTKTVVDQGISFVAQSLGSILDEGVAQAQAFFEIETKKKRFFGLSSSTSTSTQTQAIDDSLNRQIGAIFGNIADSVTQSVVLLGLGTKEGVERALRAFRVDIGEISFEGLSGEEIRQELEAVFSVQADLITEFLVPALSEYAQIGEGLFDTLTRVTFEQTVFNDTLAAMGMSLGDLSAIMQIDVAQSIIGLIGGLDEFTSAASAFVDEFFSKAEKTKLLGESLAGVFESLSVPMTATREGFRELIEAIDITTEVGQEMFAALLAISPAMADYIDLIDEQAEALQGVLNDAARDAFTMLQAAVELERERIGAVLQGERDLFSAEMQRISGVRDALKATFKELTGDLKEAESAVNSAFAAEKSAIERASGLRISAIQSEIDEAQKLHDQQLTQIDMQKSATQGIISSLSSLSTGLRGFVGQTTEQANRNLESALEAARAGNFSPALNLSDFGALGVDSGQFGTAEERNVAQAITAFRANELANLTDMQLSVEELTLAQLEQQEENENARFSRQITALDNQISFEMESAGVQTELLQSQLDNLLGLSTNVLSVDESIAGLGVAQAAISALDFDNQMIALAQQEELALQSLDQAEDAHDEQTDQLDLVITTGRAQLNALFDVNTSVLSVRDAVLALQSSLSAASALDRETQLQIAESSSTSSSSLKRQERLAESEIT